MIRTQEALLEILDRLGIEYTNHEHPAVYTVEEAARHHAGITGCHSKNLFFRDRKKKPVLVVTLSDKPVDIKQMEKKIHARGLSFARPERLMEILGVIPGAVTPFAVINAQGQDLRVILDEEMMENSPLNFHPIVNTATTTLSARDLLRFFDDCGQAYDIIRL